MKERRQLRMKRITHKVGNDYISTKIDYGELIDIDNKEWKNFVEVVEKLGKLEDLEEQIGMPLEFILKEIIGKNIYYLQESNYADYVDCELATGLGRERDPFSAELGDWQIETDSCYTFETSEYKKTWWLSEEEAEKKLEENN